MEQQSDIFMYSIHSLYQFYQNLKDIVKLNDMHINRVDEVVRAHTQLFQIMQNEIRTQKERIALLEEKLNNEQNE